MKTYFTLFWLLVLGSLAVRAQHANKSVKSDSLIKVTPIYSGRYTSTIYTMNDKTDQICTVKHPKR
ncbi:MAG: hypothetical protein EOO61_11990 [Hymenobacter sp.]|nr:MAG: hypothetical protein EOO61_11990 [Hymenobacter sp.]